MMDHEKVNILLVDDQPAKLLAYEVILKELGENLVVASSGRDALEYLLKNEVAVILVDVCMPELDGFELAAMIREHPRFQKTAMIFISAIQVSDHRPASRLRDGRGRLRFRYPLSPEVLRAKIRVFAELYRKTRQLERFNAELENRVRAGARRSWSNQPRGSWKVKKRRSLAIAAGRMGFLGLGLGQRRLDVGRRPVPHLWSRSTHFRGDAGKRTGVAPSGRTSTNCERPSPSSPRGVTSYEAEFRIKRAGRRGPLVRRQPPAATVDSGGRVVRVSGVHR